MDGTAFSIRPTRLTVKKRLMDMKIKVAHRRIRIAEYDDCIGGHYAIQARRNEYYKLVRERLELDDLRD
jgi:hypothetical protein|tara:strand:+ start:939 stop:1145 length:207 start_codon:yes stop_codon:yes gene_type:complete